MAEMPTKKPKPVHLPPPTEEQKEHRKRVREAAVERHLKQAEVRREEMEENERQRQAEEDARVSKILTSYRDCRDSVYAPLAWWFKTYPVADVPELKAVSRILANIQKCDQFDEWYAQHMEWVMGHIDEAPEKLPWQMALEDLEEEEHNITGHIAWLTTFNRDDYIYSDE